MLGLVTSTNLIQMFVFWELTTVFSFLLIGHYSDRGSSRRAAMKAILVTTMGGLAMLLGILVLGSEAGTFDLPTIIAAPPQGSAVTVAVVLLLVGAVTKSALIPFHFWLPAAMTAPTPVSAYLHAAAMVKAGIYLVARFAPAYALDPAWQSIVVVLGGGTLLFSGYQALKQHDLKLILAYGTVSQLGLLVLLVGSPYRSTALAGLALLGAHAMFKACLFLTVGVVDATTGTRDIRRLSGLGRKMPVTAVVAGLATASMIGLLPFAGYVAKEAALESLLDPEQSLASLHLFVVACFVAGSILTVAYGLRFLWGAFATKRNGVAEYPVVVSRAPLLLIGPAAVLALGGLIVACCRHWARPSSRRMRTPTRSENRGISLCSQGSRLRFSPRSQSSSSEPWSSCSVTGCSVSPCPGRHRGTPTSSTATPCGGSIKSRPASRRSSSVDRCRSTSAGYCWW